MFSFFSNSRRRREEAADTLAQAPKDFSFLGCDMHSHLVPGIDDGSQSVEDSLLLIRGFQQSGYTKLITTPHVQLEFYDNTREKLRAHFARLQRVMTELGITLELQVAAEYYLDNMFLSSVLPDGLLSFGDKYVLVEVSMAGWPRNFSDMIFAIQSMGYKPILAHPERYLYEENPNTYLELKARGVCMQMNLLSVMGYYGKTVKGLAEKLMDHKVYDFCGSDVHHQRHMAQITRLMQEQPALMAKLGSYGFRNEVLL